MNREIMERLRTEYRLQREENEREEERRKQEVRQKDPELARLMDERHSMILNYCRSAIMTPGGETPYEKMKAYNAQIHERLARGGWPEDYLEPVYACPKCRDTGWKGEDERFVCDCLRRKALAMTGTVGTAAESFEAFDETIFPQERPEGLMITQREEMRRVKRLCEEYADSFPNQQPQDLLLYGSSGLGKSYLLCCIERRLQERGKDAALYSAFDVIRLMRDAYFGREDETEPFYSAPLLLIDDLGMEPMMENVTLEQWFHLINVRRSRLLPMVISTNLTMSELKARYSERIASRLLDTRLCRVIPLKGQDVRLIRGEGRG